MRVGDIVTEINAQTVRSAADLEAALATLTAGQTVAFDLRRDGRRTRLRMSLASGSGCWVSGVRKPVPKPKHHITQNPRQISSAIGISTSRSLPVSNRPAAATPGTTPRSQQER